jgi:hypothetical protein
LATLERQERELRVLVARADAAVEVLQTKAARAIEHVRFGQPLSAPPSPTTVAIARQRPQLIRELQQIRSTASRT